MRRAALLALVFAGAATAAAGRQAVDAMPVLVHVNVMVDRDGHPVAGLIRDDFEVLSDDRPVVVESFSATHEPLTLLVLQDITASLGPGVMIARTDRGGRPALAPPAAPFGSFVIHHLGEGDRARLGAIGRKLFIDRDYVTTDKALNDAWGRVLALPAAEWMGPSPIWDAIGSAIASLADEPGQRAVIVVTDGLATGNRLGSREIAEQAALTGASVNVVLEEAVLGKGIQGRLKYSPPGPQLRLRGVDPSPPFEMVSVTSGGLHFLDEYREGSSRWPTGGYDPETFVSRIIDGLHRAYSIGFRASADGRQHSLVIKVRRAGAVVHARRSYVAMGPR